MLENLLTLKDEITLAINNKEYAKVKELTTDLPVQDIAELFDTLEEETDKIKFFRLLSKTLSAEVFSYVEPDTQELIVKALSDTEISLIIEELYIDDAVDFLEEMPANVVEKVLKNSNKDTRNTINKLLNFKEDSAGGVMTTEFLDFKRGTTVKEAFERIRKFGTEMETINVLYVTDKQRILEGVLSVKDLLLSSYDTKIEDIMNENVIFEQTDTDKETVAQMFNKYDILAMPIVDKEKRLVGIVTVDDVMEIMQDEATEDFEKMGALAPNDSAYLKTKPLKLASNRVVWLLCLMVSGVFTSMLITSYEVTFATLPLLVSCMPMLMDTSGNCGTQASTLMIRGLALGEIKLKDYFRVFFKECLVSLIVGSMLCVINFGITMIEYGDIILSLAVAISMFCVILIANFLGFSLPMLAKKLKLDPALMATPILTTLLDCCVVLIYFNIAKALLGI